MPNDYSAPTPASASVVLEQHGCDENVIHNSDEALNFLVAWAANGPWLLSAIDPKTRAIESKTFQSSNTTALTMWLQRWNGHRNLYFSVNPPSTTLRKKATKADIGPAVALHVDLDAAPGEDLGALLTRLRDFQPPPTALVFSGGGYGGFWRLAEPCADHEEVEARNRGIAQALGGDHCWNVDRIMRLPGTLNIPDAKKRARGRTEVRSYLVQFDPAAVHDLEQFPTLAQSNGNAEHIMNSSVLPSDLSGKLRNLIVSGDAAGQAGDRSRTVFHIACELVRQGWSDPQIAALLVDPGYGISAHVRAQSKPDGYAQRQAGDARAAVMKEPLTLNPRDPRPSARAFVKRQDGRLICHAGDFYQWHGSYYGKLNIEDIRTALYGFLDDAMQVNSRKELIPFAPDKAKVNNVLDALAALVHVPSLIAPPCWLDREDDARMVACRNGLVRISDGVLLPHTSDYFNTTAADFDYQPNALAPEWLQFLTAIWPDDQQAIDSLQEMMGCIVGADASFQKIFMLFGPPRCGKGTIRNVLVEMLGKGGHAGLALASLGEPFGLQPLLGKTLIVIPDARLEGRSHVLVERLLAISGRDPLDIARKHTTSLSGVLLPGQLLMLTNVLPSLTDPSGTIASRFLVLRMKTSWLGREDPTLGARLHQELPGMFNWVLSGLRRAQTRGSLIQPRSGQEAVEIIGQYASTIASFVAECMVLDPTSEERTTDVFVTWQDWWMRTGRGADAPNSTSFGMQLAAAFPQISKREKTQVHHGKRARWVVYVGLRSRGSTTESAQNEMAWEVENEAAVGADE